MKPNNKRKREAYFIQDAEQPKTIYNIKTGTIECSQWGWDLTIILLSYTSYYSASTHSFSCSNDNSAAVNRSARTNGCTFVRLILIFSLRVLAILDAKSVEWRHSLIPQHTNQHISMLYANVRSSWKIECLSHLMLHIVHSRDSYSMWYIIIHHIQRCVF